MSHMQSLKRKFKQCSKDGFWLDRNTFLKSDNVDVTLAKLKDDKGKLSERPMIIFKNVSVMTVNKKCKIISIDKKSMFSVWAYVAERALERFNESNWT